MFVFHILFYILKFINLTFGNSEMDLKMELNKSGFHREIKYSVKLRKGYLDNDCDYLLKQSLPASMYIMADQLDDLRTSRKIEIIYPSFLNTEAFSENSDPFDIFIKIHYELSSVEVSIPVHFRYHKSKNKSSTYVDIPNPLVYAIHSTVHSIYSDSLQTRKDESYRQTIMDSKLFHGNSSFTKAQIVEKCNWILLKTDYRKNRLTAEIPVGIHGRYMHISILTISFNWIIVIYTLFKIYSVLQNKI